MRTIQIMLLAFLVPALGLAQSTDRIVDASGIASSLTTIDAAMLISAPGDRILVMPGSYPPFQFSRGVHVIGLGATPAGVVVQRIAYHVSIPAANYDTLISNVTVASTSPLDVLSIHGNELAPGTLTIDGCVLQNGVFLRGGEQGFYLFINNSRILPPAGHGFTGEAAYVGGPGNFVEIRNSLITGWDASLPWFPAGVGVRFPAGTSARVINSQILGGGGALGSPFLEPGGDAMISLVPGSTNVLLDGGSLVQGGDAAGLGAGGNGTEIHGSISVGAALVAGGSGTPPGVAYGAASPAGTPGVYLHVTPELQFAQNGIAALPGETITATLGNGQLPGVMALAPAVVLPENSNFVTLPLANVLLLPVSTWSATVPQVPGFSMSGLMFYLQGAVLDPGGNLLISNTAALRIDL